MSGRIRGSSVHARRLLDDGWEFAPGALVPGAAAPDAAATGAVAPGTGAPPEGGWLALRVPGTVAAGLRAAGSWSLDAAARNFDAVEWWFRLRFEAAPARPDERVVLGFEGLATLAEVWLNGVLLVTSSNMFVEHRLDVGAVLAGANEVLIRCRALDDALKGRRPRPRWRTPMVAHQQLRWVRTSLLGRTPGWSPPAAAVGPWRPVWLERQRCCEAHDLRLKTRVVAPCGDRARGEVSVSCSLSLLGGATLNSACLVLQRDGVQWTSALHHDAVTGRISGSLKLADVALWWPHTHGRPTRYAVVLRADIALPGKDVGAVEMDLGFVGFRALELDRAAGDFALSVNGRGVFCRGACWTPLDVVSLQADPDSLRSALLAVRDAGMNMLRVAGTMVYESAEFFDLCDELGILVWQDFMFANMDYPSADAAFRDSVVLEVRQQLARLQARPALAILCGNSEGAQQAAMSGAPRECWAPVLFETDIAELANEFCDGVPYSPSSAHGGAFPHQPSVGVTSYYGVGAYRLPLHDARRSALRFASECLAFANVPENETLEVLADGRPLRCHDPRWKERVPRDQGAGWDFDDVRDHYVAVGGHGEPLELRYADHDRYLRVGRCTTGEVMAACFSEWRRHDGTCRGALVWFLRDLWPGAGWGLIDATGLPKAPYYYMKRVLQPLALFVTDEGSNGLFIHLVNEHPEPRAVCLSVRLYRRSEPVGLPVERRFTLAAACTLCVPATDLFEGFVDLSYAFRFGPAPFDILNARLTPHDSDEVLAESFHFPLGQPHGVEGHIGLSAQGRGVGDGSFELQLQTAKFAQAVHLEVPGFVADDQYFHMTPHSVRRLHLKPRAGGIQGVPEGVIHCLNSASVGRIVFTP